MPDRASLERKNLGAFYTPALYAEKSHELLRRAISRVPAGRDYVIIDRCAGVGNLERGLTDDELSHCVMSTVQEDEYASLAAEFGGRARYVARADAMSREYFEDPAVRRYVDDPECAVILFENPPYAETTSIEHQKRGLGGAHPWKKSYMMDRMREDGGLAGSVYNDLGNLFIWSAFRYYVRGDVDAYVVFSPPKYWKAQHLVSREFLGGFAFNRRHFYANIDACVLVALWGSAPSGVGSLRVEAFDIEDGRLAGRGLLDVRQVHTLYSSRFYDRRRSDTDTEDGILCEFDGRESRPGRPSVRAKPVHGGDVVGYLAVKGANFDNPDSCVHLTRAAAYDANGFFLRRDNYLEKLPMFCASRYVTYNRSWTERGRVMKSADGADRYLDDVRTGRLDDWLLRCLLFTCLEMQNHVRSLYGSDGRYYRNELCLDASNGDTLATAALSSMLRTAAERELFALWDILLSAARRTAEYDPRLAYGVYQIYAEIDVPGTGARPRCNPDVHAALQALKGPLGRYYNQEIVPALFEYEFLK